MGELLYKEEVFKLVGFCMEIHRELGKGYDEVIPQTLASCTKKPFPVKKRLT